MNRHYTTQTLSKLLTESEHNQNSHDLFNNDDDQTTSADPEFYENGNQLVEDIYDFRGLKPSLLLDSSSNNPTDDEDDDINFDYGYGYDYEKVIKDRLKIANQEFNNQPVENKRKPILVSFDNAVTAIDITEGAETPTPTAKSVAEKNNVNISTTTPLTTTTTKHANFADNIEKKKITFGYATQNNNNNNNNNPTSNHTNHETVVKLPLNDTVEKENPNEFSDKIKQAVLRYDLEMEKLNNLEKERMHNNNNNNEIGGGNSLSAVEQSNGKAGNRPPPTNGGSGSKSTSSLSNSSKSSIQSPSNSASPDLTDNSNKNSTKLSAKENVVDVDEIDDLTEPVKRAKEPEKKFQFKAAKSPSPISDNNLGGKISPDSKESKSNDNSMSINNATITTAVTATTLLNNSNDEFMTNNHHQGSANKGEEKMLIEKDGKFRLLSAEEYMAEERKRQIEQKAAAKNQNKQNKRTIKPRIPQPPTRPKTSTEPRSSLRNQFLQNNGRANQSADRSKNSSTMSTNSKNDSSNSNNINSNQAQRLSHSADFLYRKKETSESFSPIAKHPTPQYAQNYKSPYKISQKIFKPIESPEVRKKRLEEEERKREENERAFRKWIELKQKEAQEKSSKKMDEDKNNIKKMNSVDAETREKALQEWLERKRQQEEKDKEYNRKLEQFLAETRHTATAEERSKAFKEWVNRKLREKNEEARLERLEHKKWMARRRKSRKHQRLSQALEMAQAYGYSNTHYFPGFNF